MNFIFKIDFYAISDLCARTKLCDLMSDAKWDALVHLMAITVPSTEKLGAMIETITTLVEAYSSEDARRWFMDDIEDTELDDFPELFKIFLTAQVKVSIAD